MVILQRRAGVVVPTDRHDCAAEEVDGGVAEDITPNPDTLDPLARATRMVRQDSFILRGVERFLHCSTEKGVKLA